MPTVINDMVTASMGNQQLIKNQVLVQSFGTLLSDWPATIIDQVWSLYANVFPAHGKAVTTPITWN